MGKCVATNVGWVANRWENMPRKTVSTNCVCLCVVNVHISHVSLRFYMDLGLFVCFCYVVFLFALLFDVNSPLRLKPCNFLRSPSSNHVEDFDKNNTGRPQKRSEQTE